MRASQRTHSSLFFRGGAGVHNVFFYYYGRHIHITDNLAMHSGIVMIVVYFTSKDN